MKIHLGHWSVAALLLFTGSNICQASALSATPDQRPLSAEDLRDGISGLDLPAPSKGFMDDHFKYEFGDPGDHDCRKFHRRDDDCNHHRTPAVPEPSSWALIALGLALVAGLRIVRSAR